MRRKIRLYRIEIGKNYDKTKVFRPVIPEKTMYGENTEIKRVCLCDSIIGCINAMPINLEDYEEDGQCYITVWTKEFDLSDTKLFDYEKLYEKSYVPDALLTHEYWYLEDIEMEGKIYSIEGISKENKVKQYVVSNMYRDRVIKVLQRKGLYDLEAEKIDACSLLNEYIPKIAGDKIQVVMDEIFDELSDAFENEETEIDNEELKKLCVNQEVCRISNIEEIEIYNNLKIVLED